MECTPSAQQQPAISAESGQTSDQHEAVPVATTSDAVPAATTSDAVPAATMSDAVPAATTSDAVPAATTSDAVPAATTSDAVPAATTSDAVPAATTSDAVPRADAEIDFLRTYGVIDEEDIRKLIVDRESFVNQVKTEDVSFGQLLEHIHGESYLLDLCNTNINEHNIKVDNEENILTVLSNRINHLYFFMFRLFPVDVPTLLSYIKFFLNYKEHITKNSNLLNDILSKEHDDPEVYISAAKFLYDNTFDINVARRHIAAGLKYHSSYPNLYVSDFWFVTLLLHTNDGVSLPMALGIYKRILKIFEGDLSFHIKLLDCTKRFTKCGELLFHIFNDMVEMYDTNELMWRKLANTYLDGFIFDRARKCLFYDLHCKRRLESCMNAYEDGLKSELSQEGRKMLWGFYVDQVIGLWKEYGMKNESLRDFLNEEMDRIFTRAHENGMLCKPHHYFYWAEHWDKGPSWILRKAILMNNNNSTVWTDLLDLYAVNKNHNMVKKVFEDGLRSLRNRHLAWALWESMSSYIINNKDVKSIMMFYQSGINRTCINTSMRLQYKYLLWTKHIRGLSAARRLFRELKNTKRTSLKLHRCMIRLEESSNYPKRGLISRLYAETCRDFGRGNFKLWKDSIRFTYMSGLHMRAQKMLQSSYSVLRKELVDKLKNEFELFKDEYKKLNLAIDPNVINIDDDDDLPPDHPEKNICLPTSTDNNCPSTSTDNNCPSTSTDNNCPSTSTDNNCPSASTENCPSTSTDNCPSTSKDNCPSPSIEKCLPASTDSCPPTPSENFPPNV